MLKWINTTGGPLVGGELEIAKAWRGVHGLSVQHSLPDQTDYDRACGIQDYLEEISCGSGKVIVLGDEPAQTTLFLNNAGQPTIARWLYSTSKDVESIVGSIDCLQSIAEPLIFVISTNKIILFDSSTTINLINNECAELEIDPGDYDITVEQTICPDEFHFIIHRFIRRK